MKFLKNIGFVALSVMAMTSCVDADPDINTFPDADVDFTYNVADTTYVVDYYVVSKIQFNNTSAKTGNVKWDFGAELAMVDTTDINHPIVQYKTAGRYNVTLTIDGVGTKTYPILIYDIVPMLSVAEQSDSILEINKSTVDFNLELPNPENLSVQYIWTFPEGTTFLDPEVEAEVVNNTWVGYAKEIDGEYVIEYPGKVKFSHIGSQRINIETWFNIDDAQERRQLEDSYLNVQVGCNYECPTLYYAMKDGNIKALKLVDDTKVPAGTKVFPFDMGVKAGASPFNLCYGETTSIDENNLSVTQGWIYILDAGKQYYYINDEGDNLGDGKITAMGVDGSNVNTVVSNEGQAAFMDPFRGFVHKGELYYSDRNNGITKIPLATRGAIEGKDESDPSFRASYFVENDLIPYYGKGIGYGAISVGHYCDSKGVWWWGKNYSGNGIYRFTVNDIYPTAAEATAAGVAGLPYSVVLSGIKFSAFTLDEKANALYVWRVDTNSSGLNIYPIPGDNETGTLSSPATYIKLQADAENTTADEQVHTTQFAVGEDGKVWFAFRNADGGTNQGLHSGIVYYDPATQKCYQYGETSDLGFGIVINPTKSKLF